MTLPLHDKTLWLLLGQKSGDNAQLKALAEELPFQQMEMKLHYRSSELILGRLFGKSLLGINRSLSDAIVAPWPDLVLTAGRRNEAVARYIKKKSLGQTKIVHLGRPWAHPRNFDLVITTPQYQLPKLSHVVEIALPLQAGKRTESPGSKSQELRRELLALRSPRIAVLVGGQAGDFHLSGTVRERFLDGLMGLLEETRGQLMILNSPRSPQDLLQDLKARLPSESWFGAYQSGAQFNPYRDVLETADRFVVTADSISMTAEALNQGKPVQVFDSRVKTSTLNVISLGLRPLLQRISASMAPKRMHRDIMRIHEALRAEGRISFLGESVIQEPRTSANSLADMERARNRVLELFD